MSEPVSPELYLLTPELNLDPDVLKMHSVPVSQIAFPIYKRERFL